MKKIKILGKKELQKKKKIFFVCHNYYIKKN